ncbi:hypothetical protein CP985_11815 [Malaciobacter mytili LMG 24559]|uniref:Phosphoribosylanthranilate isomerase n=1 Tax=Malaciobacter mytili LMG 24559 TaxID=1032238 RepID=A0AAX2ACQ5_9BACT|nr:hypothetical protein [Malaciobacter mytili]AXH16350.1 hypothetical protein AMYT_a0050 [Malaciobacter mytili LMG 24559]RXK14799.1 hypothetical protein CP985_11815 [Malaciobacter mytili LMG 24559]
MKIYFACPTGKRRDNILKEYGYEFGACLTRDTFNHITARTMHWFFDNGAFSDWQNKRPFNAQKFIDQMWRIESEIRFGKPISNDLDFSSMERGEPKKYKLVCPEFVVCPDLPARGNESLEFSRKWIDYLEDTFPYYDYFLAVQNEMSFELVEDDLKNNRFSGLFVGGTKEWKYKEASIWVELAHKYGIPCHIGGIGNRKSILWAKSIGADSVDSGVAMIHPKHLAEILNIKDDMFWNVA